MRSEILSAGAAGDELDQVTPAPARVRRELPAWVGPTIRIFGLLAAGAFWVGVIVLVRIYV